MENIGLSLIFWYGILHAFGPDHLTAIADFSIGKNKNKTMLITILFAIGHGTMLFIFAKLLEIYNISEQILGYGDIISSGVILAMGIYLLYMVVSDKIHLNKHIHNGVEHIHIYFGKKHSHTTNTDTTSALTMGALMGIGGVRGMLITLGVIQGQSVDLSMVLAFTSGVMIIFVAFGGVILYINQNLLKSKKNIRTIFATAGVVSVLVGGNMLFADEPIHSHAIPHTHNITNTKQLLATKRKSNITYKQMMTQMGEAYKMIQTGVLTQNKELIALGCNIIQNHPAPKTKPWLIMPKNLQEDFKQTLISYDKILHKNTNNIVQNLDKDFTTINQKVYNLSNSCISCHSYWQDKVIK